MCGIVGYIGSKPAREIIINGLKRLEYRGYDSAGMALVNGEARIYKCAGRVKDLEEIVNKSSFNGTTGMGHTRWATHGEPNELNAHPQVSYKGNFVVVHNGIIENYSTLKKHLESRGVKFSSQTDTEVLANLIEHLYIEGDLTAEQAITSALNRVVGAYGLVIICTNEPDRLFAAKKGSPLVIGVGEGENFIASDATPIVEFTKRVIYLNDDDLVIAISQSGETADTLAAVKLAREKGAKVIGICNVVGSSIPRETDAGVYTHAGPEIGVASTKAFTTQVTVLAMMAFEIGHKKGILSDAFYKELITELASIPVKIENALKVNDQAYELAKVFQNTHNALYLGRGYLFPVALEGALKLKEISYIHAEGYPAAEMKHGPIALIDENMPVVVVATKDDTYEKIISNIQEIKARKGKVVAIVTEGDEIISKMADYVLEVPETLPIFSGLLAVIPLQLLSYHIAVLRGCNVDQPRNLAKSVTVE